MKVTVVDLVIHKAPMKSLLHVIVAAKDIQGAVDVVNASYPCAFFEVKDVIKHGVKKVEKSLLKRPETLASIDFYS